MSFVLEIVETQWAFTPSDAMLVAARPPCGAECAQGVSGADSLGRGVKYSSDKKTDSAV